MRAYESTATITREGRLELPKETVRLLPRECLVRVIVLVPEPTDNNSSVSEDTAWSTLTTQEFFAGYSEADSIYDQI